MSDDHKRSDVDWDAIKKRVEGAVERGDMTREEADAVYRGLKQRQATDGRKDDDMWKRVAGSLAEAGIPRDKIREVMGAMGRTVEEIRAEGDRFELDPQLQAHLAELGLTDEQIQHVVRLSRRLAAANRDGDRGDRDPGHVGIGGTITAVDRAGITLRTERGEVRVVVTDRTRITRNGEPARLTSLQVRDGARVSGQVRRDGRPITITAKEIHARGARDGDGRD